MKGLVNCCALVGMMLPGLVLLPMVAGATVAGRGRDKMINLPDALMESSVSVEEALLKRRSERHYADTSMKLQDIAQLLWAAQGLTGRTGFRTAPSAGALYPLEVYVVAGNVEGLSAGIYQYQPAQHRLLQMVGGDLRADLTAAALGQPCIQNAPACIVVAAVYERATRKYRERGIRYVHMEAGHAAQNVYLQAVSLDLGTVVIGAFHDEKVQRILELPDDVAPLVIMPVGKRR